ncbi:thioredoxin domain-containing protein [Muriicola soli]|uniref:Thioredoxin domain-containing protein n=1 Tax=Muriicola soli TaxID=2507538 RepID=A0A411E8C9_9FLAO|nr:thioredoxin domain-containing protein [Muriicola soli]QBA63837.1 thioredoxin domain-containing protein [Muriicola soli]
MKLSSRFSFLLITLLILIFSACKDKANKDQEHKFTNALVHETSPYLLQHAHNPVNWVAWSDEALEKAREEEKLIIVSIGYSSCHWCHVMEEECFEDVEVAALMNENFINIKVDREERPDVDEVYMTAVQLMTGNGGWPLNVILLSNGKPLYGGTYHTKAQWMEVLTEVNTKYNNDKAGAEDYANRVAKGIAEVNFIPKVESEQPLPDNLLEQAMTRWKPQWDMEKGGNQGREKFIIPANLDYLLDYARLTDDLESDVFVKNTLDNILLGGIYDHIGGGFFRYSTDPNWKVPHFEKMLYDQAQLISLYAKAYAIYKEPAYKDAVLQTIAFLEREMKGPDGGFYAAMDADSEGIEGAYYTWKEVELNRLLRDDFGLFAEYYSINPASSWEEDLYVLFKSQSDAEFAREHDITFAQLSSKKASWHQDLLAARKQRTMPRKDDKVITSWNALLISGLIDAYKAFDEEVLLDKAKGLFRSLKASAVSEDKVIHSYKNGSTREEGFLEDYAFLARTSFSLYETSLDTTYLDFTRKLMEEVESRFFEKETGMYQYNENNDLISRIIKIDDGVLPSPNAVVAENYLLLGHLNYDIKYLEKVDQMLMTISPRVLEAINNHSYWAKLMLSRIKPYYEIVVVGPDAELLSLEFHKLFLPNALVVGSLKSSNLALFKDRYVHEETYIYVCTNNTCKLPVKTVTEALQQLQDFGLNLP